MTHAKHNDHGPDDATQKCPICGGAVTRNVETFPFCTARCRKIDLGKWLKEEYKVSRPIEQSDLDEE